MIFLAHLRSSVLSRCFFIQRLKSDMSNFIDSSSSKYLLYFLFHFFNNYVYTFLCWTGLIVVSQPCKYNWRTKIHITAFGGIMDTQRKYIAYSIISLSSNSQQLLASLAGKYFFDFLEKETFCREVTGNVMTQQNSADRSGNEDGTSVPTSTIHMPFFLIGETAFLSPLLKRHLGWWKWKRFFPIHWL